jgi:tripartite-type tricarboxylate transporter receptor subunit TctC
MNMRLSPPRLLAGAGLNMLTGLTMLVSLTMVSLTVVGTRAEAEGRDALEAKGPIRIIVGYSPGNSGDTIARVLAEKMSMSLGVPVYVENKVGAGSRIAVDALKHSQPDGKTMMVSTFSVMGIFPMISAKPTYQLSDFEPVAHIANSNVVIAAPIDAPYRTLAEYADWLKANPSRAQFGNEAAGSPAHLMGLEFGRMIGVNNMLIPYKSTTQMISDLIANQIPAATLALPSIYELHRARQVRILAIASEQRSPSAPDLPTLKEAGYGLSVNSMYGAWMPLNTPKPVVDRLSRSIVDAIAQGDVQEKFRLMGLEPTGKGRAEFVGISDQSLKDWAKILKDTGFKLEE